MQSLVDRVEFADESCVETCSRRGASSSDQLTPALSLVSEVVGGAVLSLYTWIPTIIGIEQGCCFVSK